MEHYDASLLDALCLTGEIGWTRLSAAGQTSVPVPATPIALFLREHAEAWRTLRRLDPDGRIAEPAEIVLDDTARTVVDRLREQGASFFKDLAVGCGFSEADLRGALGRLVGAGLVTSDGFAGLRAIVRGAERLMTSAGRWSATSQAAGSTEDAAIEASAWTLLRRYGVVFRRLLTRESNPPSWRLLTRTYRRLEARGEIRGGRFVAGMPGEQFALPGAVERLREIRRTPVDGRLLSISAADPLNLAGVLDSGDRVRAVSGSRLVYRDGVALAAMEGDYVRQMAPVDDAIAAEVASLLAGRRVPAILNGFLGR
jgi:ATP-dependent Lhr-like helicase